MNDEPALISRLIETKNNYLASTCWWFSFAWYATSLLIIGITTDFTVGVVNISAVLIVAGSLGWFTGGVMALFYNQRTTTIEDILV